VIVDGEPFASETPGGAANECLPAGLRRKVEPDGTLGDTRIGGDRRRPCGPGQGGRRLALLKLVSGMLRWPGTS